MWEGAAEVPGSLWGLPTDSPCCPINTEGFLNPRFGAGAIFFRVEETQAS